MPFDAMLEHKNVLVTGGSRGLGQAICFYFAQSGANVAFNYRNDDVAAKDTLEKITNLQRKGAAYQCSVSNENDMNAMVKTIEKDFGLIDILINNAGVSEPLPIALMDAADWDKVMDVNSKGQFIAARAVLPGMIRRKSGVILNIGSLAGIRLIEAPVHYAASKAAAKGFTEALSKEVARYNIKVNCLAPGLLNEGVGQRLPEYRLKDYVNHVSLGRVGELEEVAKVAAFMVSDKNSYMNGETLLMDGGL
ncbi:3-oxoacyl-[acyl-carrier protein] reductase [hydrothermal vent metagenome]|uniref:3-oxoacyl-[acyl-carrier protein] reductase n=1 Tax=hydrothermal vent metagenome TaxID=652676 RepID=A0A3B0Z371_9ZZZZ